MLGLSLLLSVGAYAQAHLQQAKAQKASAATEKTEQTVSLKSKYSNNVRTRSASSGTAGFVEQVVSTSKALTPKKGSSKAKAPVTTDKIYAGMQFPQALLGGGKINPATGAFTKIFSSNSAPQSIGVNPETNEIYTVEWTLSSSGYGNIAYRTYDATSGAKKKEVTITSQEQFDFTPIYGAYVLDDNAIYGYANEGWVKLDCSTLTSSVVNANVDDPRRAGLGIYGMTYNSNTGEIVALVEQSTGFSIIKINKETGVYSEPVAVNVSSQYLGGFAYDYSSNSYLFNPNDDDVSES